MSTPRNFDKPNAPEQGGEEGKPAPAHHPEISSAKSELARKGKPGEGRPQIDPDNPAKIQQVLADPGGPVPREVKPEERAPHGFTRFKVSCHNYTEIGSFPPLYILVKSAPEKTDKQKADAKESDPNYMDQAETDARAFYLKHVGLDKTLERLQKNKTSNIKTAHLLANRKGEPEIEPIEPADLAVKQLED